MWSHSNCALSMLPCESTSVTLVSIKSTCSFLSSWLRKLSTSCKVRFERCLAFYNSKKPVEGPLSALGVVCEFHIRDGSCFTSKLQNGRSAHELLNKRKALCNKSLISFRGNRNRQQIVWVVRSTFHNEKLLCNIQASVIRLITIFPSHPPSSVSLTKQ